MQTESSGLGHEDGVVQAMREHQLSEKITEAVLQLLAEHTHHTNNIAGGGEVAAFVNYEDRLNSRSSPAVAPNGPALLRFAMKHQKVANFAVN